MATEVTPIQRKSIQERTVVYTPMYVNGMTEADTKGAYVLFYIFSDSPTRIADYNGRACIVEYLNKIGQQRDHTFVKIGNFSSGSKSRWASNKGDLIKNDGNRSPAARHSQDILINYPKLYLHFMMVVLSPDTVEKNLEDSLKGIVDIHNKQEKVQAAPGTWRTPIPFTSKAVLSKKIADRINSKL